MLEKSHLFSNSDLYCDAEDLSVFMTFQPSRKKKKIERGNVKVHWPSITSVLLGICMKG